MQCKKQRRGMLLLLKQLCAGFLNFIWALEVYLFTTTTTTVSYLKAISVLKERSVLTKWLVVAQMDTIVGNMIKTSLFYHDNGMTLHLTQITESTEQVVVEDGRCRWLIGISIIYFRLLTDNKSVPLTAWQHYVAAATAWSLGNNLRKRESAHTVISVACFA